MKALFRAEEKAYNAIQAVAIVLLVFMTTLFFIQTVLRYIFNFSLAWAEELCRYALIWAVFLESGIGVTKTVHVGFDLLSSRLKGTAATISYLIVQICLVVVGAVITMGGYTLTMQVKAQLSASLGISMAVFYSSMIVGGVLMVIFSCFNILRKLVKAE